MRGISVPAKNASAATSRRNIIIGRGSKGKKLEIKLQRV
jgi:hypothetical protein